MEITPDKNTGVLIRPPILDKDWVFGAETGAPKIILEPSGQYDDFLPDEELQFHPGTMDTMACVTFSALNNIETVLNWYLAKDLLPTTHKIFLMEEGYIDPITGKVNFSDRFTATMSGTTRTGNYLDAVADSIRSIHGLLPEKDWPWPDMSHTNGFNWEIYYAPIPQELQAKAKRFLDYFDLFRQWIISGVCDTSNIKEILKYGPIQIASTTCAGWSTNSPILACGCQSANHATMIYGSTDDSWKDFDHYVPFRKKLASDYGIPWGMQFIMKAKDLVPAPLPTFHYNFTKQLKFNDLKNPMDEVHALQQALQILRRPNGKPYMKIDTFGPFGPITKFSLGLFQTDNGIKDQSPLGQGIDFGPLSWKAMNKRLNT